jgi:hypothetical protein
MTLEAQTDGSVEIVFKDQGEMFERGVTVDADGGHFRPLGPRPDPCGES